MTQIAMIKGSYKAGKKNATVNQLENGQVLVTWSDGQEVRFENLTAYQTWTSFNPYIYQIN